MPAPPARHRRLVVAILATVLALCAPGAAHANERSGSYMLGPALLHPPGWWYGSRDESPDEDGEPVTPGSGSSCPDDYGGWTLTATHWYQFYGTGGPMVVRLDGNDEFAMVVYQPEIAPAVDNALACVTGRYTVDTVAGKRYVVQVGSRGPWAPDSVAEYRLSVASPAVNDERANALALPFDTDVYTHSFGATTADEEVSKCIDGRGTTFGGRSVWLRLDAPSPGTVHVEIYPLDFRPIAYGWLAVVPGGGTTPTTCSTEALTPATYGARLDAQVPQGISWVQVMSWSGTPFDADAFEEFWVARAHYTADLDVDDDGHARPSDCNDRDPAIHPGAPETTDDGVDQDCDGRDAHGDRDGDDVPDYRDRCPTVPTDGIDRDRDGCPDPRQLAISVQVALRLRGRRLHVVRLLVRTTPGAHVTLACGRRACQRATIVQERGRLGLGRLFAPAFPNRTGITVSATKPGMIGIAKQYRLTSTAGLEWRRTWCTGADAPQQRVACE